MLPGSFFVPTFADAVFFVASKGDEFLKIRIFNIETLENNFHFECKFSVLKKVPDELTVLWRRNTGSLTNARRRQMPMIRDRSPIPEINPVSVPVERECRGVCIPVPP